MNAQSPKLWVQAKPHDAANVVRVEALASRLGIGYQGDPPPDTQLVVMVTHAGLSLRVPAGAPGVADACRGGHSVQPEFASLDTASSAGRALGSPLFRALGVKKGQGLDARPEVFDATAGMLEDTWLLASAGCRVTAAERSPVLHAMLEDALHRASRDAPETASRITLKHGEAGDVLSQTLAGSPRPVSVLIDPMFPSVRKAAERKSMRVLRLLVGDDRDAKELMQRVELLASAGGVKRIAVKRPRRAEPLTDRVPSHRVEGKGHRFDVYVLA